MAARALLARHQGQAREIAEPGDALGVAGRHDQALHPPGPFDQNDRHARHGALEVTPVPVLGLGLVDVHAGGDRLAGGKPGQPVQAAVEERRELAAGFAQRPLEQRIVAAGDHRRAPMQPFGAAGVFRLLPHPGLDHLAREQQLAGDPAHRDRLLGDQLVHLALLDPEQRGHFLGGQELGHDTVMHELARVAYRDHPQGNDDHPDPAVIP